MWLSIESSRVGFLLTVLSVAGCGSSGPSPADQDTAVAEGDTAIISETGVAPQLVSTLDTGVDLETFAAAATPQVIQLFSSMQPDTGTDNIRLGRPWGEFDVHKGPRLVFRGSWRVLVANDGDYVTIATVVPDGDSYKVVGIGSDQFIPTMVAREQMAGVSAALDRGRAAFLRRINDGGDMFAAYETGEIPDAGQPEIRVQPLALQIIDGGFGVAEMSLEEFDSSLPAE